MFSYFMPIITREINFLLFLIFRRTGGLHVFIENFKKFNVSKVFLIFVVAIKYSLSFAETIYPPAPLVLPHQGAPGEKVAAVVIFRGNGDYAASHLATVKINDEKLTKLPPSSYVFVCLSPGDVILGSDLSAGIFGEDHPIRTQSIFVYPGQTKYFEIPTDESGASIRLVEAGTARRSIKNLVEVGFANDRDAVGRYYTDNSVQRPRGVIECQ